MWSGGRSLPPGTSCASLRRGRKTVPVPPTPWGSAWGGDARRLVFAVFRKGQEEFRGQVQEQVNQLAGNGEIDTVHLAFFVKDMRSRIGLEEMFSPKACRRVAEQARKAAGRSRKLRVVPPVCILMQRYPKRLVKLEGLNSFERVCEPPVDRKIHLETQAEDAASPGIQAVTCTVGLYKLVQLYNLVGDQLFRNNVRFGIRDNMGVDLSIRRTLEKEPEHFYYKNNGITILVGNGRSVLAGADELVLGEISPDTNPDFSVVNGAQTITAAAQYFFELEYKQADQSKTEEERSRWKRIFEHSRRHARVLLRAIQVSEGVAGRQLSGEISISLNRQKPIRMEDIAFTTPDVQRLCECAKTVAAEPFCLTRRGEEAAEHQSLILGEFVRARIACAGSPGDARNESEKKLLMTRPGEDGRYIFVRKGIIAPDWADAEGEAEAAIFRRDYGAVLFAHQVAQEYERRVQDVQAGDLDYINALGNGRWYFSATLVQLLNGFRMREDDEKYPDFTHFSGRFQDIKEKIPQAMDLYVRLIVLCAWDNQEINSNLFKKEELYREIILGLKQGFSASRGQADKELLARQLLGLFQVSRPEQPEQPQNEASPSQMATRLEQLLIPESHVCLDGQVKPVQSDAEALETVTEYVLNLYPVSQDAINLACGTWITFDRERAQSDFGYFRGSPRKIRVGGTDCWVGTSSNTKTKCRCMRSLCEAFLVPQKRIQWYKGSQRKVIFDW